MGEAELQARALPAERGIGWIGEGFGLFRQSPWVWVALTVLWLLVNALPNWVPVLGPLALSLLWPVFGAGLLLGCRAQADGQPLEIRHLFAGFGPRLGPLVGLGALSLAASVVLVAVIALALLGASQSSTELAQTLAAGPGGPEELRGLAATAVIVVLVAAALSVPLVMGFWFAPALVVFDGLGPLAAVLASFVGCLRNLLPMLLFGLIGLVLLVLGALPLGLGLLVVIPILVCAVYVSYREIYGPTPP
jgi:uncharacterized membrane protein